MADIHDAAMEWAQKNSQDPRAQDIMAKAWSAKNPQDPRAAQIQAKFNTPPTPTPTNGTQSSNNPVLPPEKPIQGTVTSNTLMKASNPANQWAINAAPEAGGGVVNPAMEWGMGKVAGGLKSIIGPAVQRNKILGMVKNKMEDLGPYISDKLTQAKSAFTESNIAPKMAEQQRLAEGKTITINPKNYMGYDADVDAMMQKHLNNASSSSMYGAPDTMEIPLSDALDARAKLNQASQFKRGMVYSDEAAARNNAARAAGDNIRAQIGSHPEVGEQIAGLSDELQSHYNLRNDVMSTAPRTPIQTILGNSPDKISKLAQFDQSAGSNLRQLGKDVDTAVGRLGDSRAASIIGKTDIPSAIARETLGRSGRMYDASMSGLDKFIGNKGIQGAAKTGGLMLRKGKSQDEE